MEDGRKEKEEPLLERAQEKGGFRTLPFIIGNLFSLNLVLHSLKQI